MTPREKEHRRAPAGERIAAWQRRRSELTHDWFRNRFLPHLGACLALARSDAVATPELVRGLVATVHEWPARGVEALRLADEFCRETKPQPAIDTITVNLPASLASYVQRTAFEMWKARHGVEELLDAVRASYHLADTGYAAWARRCPAEPGVHDLVSGAAALAALATHAERLATDLCRLPFRVSL